jgi:hypothetical protein
VTGFARRREGLVRLVRRSVMTSQASLITYRLAEAACPSQMA